jgi:hypothetical protein
LTILITSLCQLDILEQLSRQVLPGTKHREKDLINEIRVQLYADLLPEELLNEAWGHYFSLFKEVLVYLMIILCIKSNL